MVFYHVLLITFKGTLSQEEIKASCDKIRALGDNCLHPTTQKPYLKVLGVGKENSVEGRNDGVTHVAISMFENKEDREYYVQKDPAHHDVITTLKPQLSRIQVVDFTPGEV